MEKIVIIILFSIYVSGCELIVIGTKADINMPELVSFDQNSALGAIYLFKAELDSNNVPAATQLIAKPEGTAYLALERYEKYFDIYRIKRMISSREITHINSDTLTGGRMKYNLEFDYLRKMYFTALKIENNWYITEMGSYE